MSAVVRLLNVPSDTSHRLAATRYILKCSQYRKLNIATCTHSYAIFDFKTVYKGYEYSRFYSRLRASAECT